MKIKLCNIHKMTLANEGEERKPIHIPFGTWDYDETITQTLDKPHAEAIAADLSGKIAAGEPGIPVYQGHPDVPEYAGKYPDKGALGWVKKIMVNEDGMDLFVDWDRDPGKGFGWFSPYWVGDRPTVGSGGKKNVIVDGLNSIGLVNNPNIREFRLANEAQPEKPAFELPAHIAALAKRFDDRKAMANVIDANGMGHSDENGQFDGSGSGKGGGGGSLEETRGKLQKMLKHEAISVAAGGNPATASKDAVHFEYRGKRYYVGKDSDHMVKQFEDAGLVKRVNAGTSAAKTSVADTFKAAAKKAAKDPMAIKFNDALKTARKNKDGAGIARAHMAALRAGMVWDKSIKGYRPPVAK